MLGDQQGRNPAELGGQLLTPETAVMATWGEPARRPGWQLRDELLRRGVERVAVAAVDADGYRRQRRQAEDRIGRPVVGAVERSRRGGAVGHPQRGADGAARARAGGAWAGAE